jgi:ABC-type cobalamin/Fe3+-siderophores transport system ATPase subunit
LFELETYFPEDLITINLKVGEEYRPFYKISENGGKIYQLSDGQRATALLIFLFSQENKILIIDQPEEDLDNRFVYDDVVVMLRQMKGKRQLIFATHNANIPVLGDSDQIIVLEAENNQCSIKDSGSIDKFSISDDIKKVMEGGEEAFKKRIQKYGVKYE